MMQNGDNTDREISKMESADQGESTLSSDIEEDNLDNPQEVLHLGRARRDKIIRTTRVPLPKNQSCAQIIIARTSLPNL
jgi:hypothetical protein